MTMWAAKLDKVDSVGWLRILPVGKTIEESLKNEEEEFVEVHLAVGLLLQECRFDPDIRVVVLTGTDDEFYTIASTKHYGSEAAIERTKPIMGIGGRNRSRRQAPSALETLALIEKPVIARICGDAFGFGQSLMWGCDIIVAAEDALIADAHMSQGSLVDSKGEHVGSLWGLTPGDGAMSFVQQFMPPAMMKEYMMLSRSLTFKELAQFGLVNYAVPRSQIDGIVERLIAEFLRRPASALARTKRVCNKHIIQQWNLTQDLAWAYEIMDFSDIERKTRSP